MGMHQTSSFEENDKKFVHMICCHAPYGLGIRLDLRLEE